MGGDGGTPINWIVHHDNVDIIRLMVENGAELNIRNQWGMTELHTAIWRGTPKYLYFKKPNPIEMSDSELDEYEGKYYVGDYLFLEVWRESNQLKIMEFGPDEIYPVAKDFFYFKQAPWTLIFSRNQEGEIYKAQLSFIRRSYTIVKR